MRARSVRKRPRAPRGWARGITGFSLNLDVDEINRAIDMARTAWAAAGRTDPPRFLTACFYAVGDDGPGMLAHFTRAYFTVFGVDLAAVMAEQAALSSTGALRDALTRVAEQTAVDEVLLVPAGVEAIQAEGATEVVAAVLG